MDFGIGFISNNIMLPILDFFYGIVPSYGLAIIALTLVVRFAVFPLSAKSIRSMRRSRIAQPLMQKRVKEIQAKYKNDPAKQQQEMSAVYQEFGNPLAGCLPVFAQMPILFALFATLRGSPFSDVNYDINVEVLPADRAAEIQPVAFATPPKNIYFNETFHAPALAVLPGGTKLAVGEKAKVEFQSEDGKILNSVLPADANPEVKPDWHITTGNDKIKVNPDGTIEALASGTATIQGTLPGLASKVGFLFIDALGRVGAVDKEGGLHWDIISLIAAFGLSTYLSQQLAMSGQKKADSDDPAAQQQQTINQITPLIITGMFVFFPLPAGVLMYMVIANIFQTAQTYILNREPLPADLQKMLDDRDKEIEKQNRETLPFEKPKPGKNKDKKKPAN
jgi:YidC/Oxa1 family membrane protein insertase